MRVPEKSSRTTCLVLRMSTLLTIGHPRRDARTRRRGRGGLEGAEPCRGVYTPLEREDLSSTIPAKRMQRIPFRPSSPQQNFAKLITTYFIFLPTHHKAHKVKVC